MSRHGYKIEQLPIDSYLKIHTMKRKNLFRRIYGLGTLCTLSGMLVLAACTEEAATGLPADGAAIRFDVGLSETWESGGSAPSPVSGQDDTATSAGRSDMRAEHGADGSGASSSSARRSTESMASYMTVTVIDGIPPRTKTAFPQTRGGTQQVNNENFFEVFSDEGFSVSGFVSDDDGSSWGSYMTNARINSDGTPAGACNWPGSWRDCQVRFFACAPYLDENGRIRDYNDNTVTIEYNYNKAEDAANQKDFLVGASTTTYKSVDGYPDEVPLNFTHALAAVQFKIMFTGTGTVSGSRELPRKITGITIGGVSESGTCYVKDNGGTLTVTWKEQTEKDEGGGGGFSLSSDDFEDLNLDQTVEDLGTTEQSNGSMCWKGELLDNPGFFPDNSGCFFLMIPQKIESVDVSLSFEDPDAYPGEEFNLEINVSPKDGVVWEPGKAYICTIYVDYRDVI